MEPLQNPQLDPLLLLMSLVERVPLQRDARMADHALRALEEAEQIARKRLAMRAHAGDPNFRFYLAAALCERGLILLEMTGKLRDAEKAFGESEGLLATLRKNYAEISFYRPKHAEALSGRGAARAALGSLSEAEADCRAAQALLEPVVQKSPRDTSAACLLARTLSRRATHRVETERPRRRKKALGRRHRPVRARCQTAWWQSSRCEAPRAYTRRTKTRSGAGARCGFLVTLTLAPARAASASRIGL